MQLTKLLTLIFVFFLTSIISVVTGSTSLITVPVMIQFGIEPHIAIATNMFALIFLSMGGLAPLWRSGALPRRHLSLSIVLTIIGSLAGALLLSKIPVRPLQVIIVIAMVAVTFFSVIRPQVGVAGGENPSTPMALSGYGLTLLLAVYGGFFSGGYVTILTAVFAVFFEMTFLQSIAATKLINIFSSLVATAIFTWERLIDFKLAIILGIAMFLGGLLGGKIALRLHPKWLRVIFLIAVLALAARMLVALL
jgi:uncharacterized membrane protein YfcA